MKLEVILSEWEIDSTIDPDELVTESLKISKLHFKYISLYTKEHLIQRNMEQQLTILRSDKADFFTKGETKETRDKGWEFPGKILKMDVGNYLDKDSDIVKMNIQLFIQKEKCELLESILRNIQGRSFNIKNAIDWEKFRSGG